jgi:hypothetical protein|tara:strand:+ start:420 stop:617 length:198 start_codon:yes stop_codon:yes gene_type:complete
MKTSHFLTSAYKNSNSGKHFSKELNTLYKDLNEAGYKNEDIETQFSSALDSDGFVYHSALVIAAE